MKPTESMKLRTLLLGLLPLVTSSFAATYLSGPLTTRTWTASGSPYVLTNDTTVPVGQTLTIQPGVTVKGRECVLLVQGTIIATGTLVSPIVFTSETTPTRWGGVRLEGATASSLSYCRFSYVGNYNYSNGTLHFVDCNPPVDNCIIENNDVYGLRLENSSPTISRCIIRNNSYIAVYSTGGAPKLYNTLICNNSASSYSAGVTETVTMRNCTIAMNENTSGNYQAFASPANSTFMNCIIAANSPTYGNSFDGNVLNCLDGSATFPPTFKNPTLGPGKRDLDDTLTGYPADYSLTATSPGVDQGNNTYAAILPTDLAGNARINNVSVDIGCYEYVPNYGSNLTVNIERAVRITSGSEPGKRYQFRYTTQLGGTNWFTIGDVIYGTGGTIGIFDSVSNATSRFYRTFVLP
jgi:parallel beta-helix repeat protein